jgi:hypothetical protein
MGLGYGEQDGVIRGLRAAIQDAQSLPGVERRGGDDFEQSGFG